MSITENMVLAQGYPRRVGMIYVSHRLDEVFDIADRVVVLRDGRTAGVRDVAHTSPEQLTHGCCIPIIVCFKT